jgi:hypothetical protein
MPDYADWTESVELLGTEITIPIEIEAVTVNVPITIAGSDIQMPVDIQGSYIQMPVDIQGQYITLKIDIVAQSVGNIGIDIKAQTIGNIAVNIAASAVTLNVAIQSSAVTLNVNISSQTGNININIAAQAGNVTIEVKAQTVAVKTQGEWSPQAGQQKYVTGSATIASFQGTSNVDYSVTSGKTLYITHLSFSCGASASANADLYQMGKLLLYNYSTSTWLAVIGGNGGQSVSFPTPIKVLSTHVIRMIMQNYANHSLDMFCGWGGYEI